MEQETQQPAVVEKQSNSEEHKIWIGDKPFMNYVTGLVMMFSTKKAKSVSVLARGKFISRAVDVCEVVRTKFLKDSKLSYSNIKMGSVDITPDKKGVKPIRVSTIEITISA